MFLDVAVHGAQDSLERGGHDVTVHAHAKAGWRIIDAGLHIASCTGFGAGANRMLMVVNDADGEIQAVDECRDGTVTGSGERATLSIDFEDSLDFKVLALSRAGVTRDAMLDQRPW